MDKRLRIALHTLIIAVLLVMFAPLQAASPYDHIRQGESLLTFSKRVHIPVEKIIQYNNMRPPYKVFIGQPLFIQAPFIPSRRPAVLSDITPSESSTALEDQNALDNNPIQPDNRDPPLHSMASDHLTAQDTNAIDPDSTADEETQQSIQRSREGFSWPLNGPLLNRFGQQKGGEYNNGIRIQAKSHAPVYTAAAGEVIYVGQGLRYYGNLILIRHDHEWVTAYSQIDHMKVETGDKVHTRQKIAEVTQQPAPQGPHLYFEIRRDAIAVDPIKYLPPSLSKK